MYSSSMLSYAVFLLLVLHDDTARLTIDAGHFPQHLIVPRNASCAHLEHSQTLLRPCRTVRKGFTAKLEGKTLERRVLPFPEGDA